MAGVPANTLYHRWLGWHAPAMRRLVVAGSIGLTVVLVLLGPATPELAVIAGWDAAALVFLLAVVPVIVRAGAEHTALLATREDETRPPPAGCCWWERASPASWRSPSPSARPAGRAAPLGSA